MKEICHNGQCEKRTCPRRHPRKCKFFFLRDHCKFGEFCEYSHDIKNNQNEELLQLKDALEETRRESKTSKNIEKENSNLRKANESLMKDVKKKAKQLEEAQTQELKALNNLKEILKINENLIKDIKVLNAKLYAFVPDSIHKENEELKETIEVLRAVIDVYKQAEIDAENQDGGSEDTPVKSYLSEKQIQLKCNLCSFTTESKRGLSVHIGRMHTENQNGNNLITF